MSFKIHETPRARIFLSEIQWAPELFARTTAKRLGLQRCRALRGASLSVLLGFRVSKLPSRLEEYMIGALFP